MEVLHGDILTHGPQTKAFEQEFAGFVGGGAQCVAVSSCMAALHLAYLTLGIGPGDEVLVPAQTHVATVHAVEAVGARPVFVDCRPETGNIDPDRLESLVTERTRAIGLVHFIGIPCEMDAIMDVASRHNLRVVEDCALAVGAKYKGKHVGLIGDAGCFSFYPVKHITTGEGGMFVSRHKELAEKATKVRGFGVDRSYAQRAASGMYDVTCWGLNYRMSEIQAALGRVQLSRVGEILERRCRNFRALKQALAGQQNLRVLDAPGGGRLGDGPVGPACRAGQLLVGQVSQPVNQADRLETCPTSAARQAGPTEVENSHYCLSVVLGGALAGRRDEVTVKLKEAGVSVSVYYPQPVPRMVYYREKYGYDAPAYARAAAISDQSIALPVGPHLTEDDVRYVADALLRVIGELTT